MYVNGRLKLRTVVFYATTDDRRPVEEWLDSLDDARAEAVAMGIKFFEEYPNPIVPAKFLEKVAGTHLWEIKCHYGKEQYRLLAFTEGNSIIIATHGFSKKTWKIPRREVQVAEARRNEYLHRKKQPTRNPL
jgi:phage-related protein